MIFVKWYSTLKWFCDLLFSWRTQPKPRDLFINTWINHFSHLRFIVQRDVRLTCCHVKNILYCQIANQWDSSSIAPHCCNCISLFATSISACLPLKLTLVFCGFIVQLLYLHFEDKTVVFAYFQKYNSPVLTRNNSRLRQASPIKLECAKLLGCAKRSSQKAIK